MVEDFRPEEVAGVWTPEAFPLYYSDNDQFRIGGAGGVPGGAAGAIGEVDIPLNTYPHILWSVRLANTYNLRTDPDGLLPVNFRPIDRLGLLIWDEEQRVRVIFAQQNIIADPMLQAFITGRMNGIHWHPLPSPYLLRGANNVRVEAVRITGYPTLGDAQNQFEIIPTIDVGLVTSVLVTDLFPAGPPGSTGHVRGGAGRPRG